MVLHHASSASFLRGYYRRTNVPVDGTSRRNPWYYARKGRIAQPVVQFCIFFDKVMVDCCKKLASESVISARLFFFVRVSLLHACSNIAYRSTKVELK